MVEIDDSLAFFKLELEFVEKSFRFKFRKFRKDAI